VTSKASLNAEVQLLRCHPQARDIRQNTNYARMQEDRDLATYESYIGDVAIDVSCDSGVMRTFVKLRGDVTTYR
jgi:hypothetical protein